MELCSRVDSACASYENFSLIFRVKVEKHLAAEEARLEGHRSVKSCFFRGREETFDLAAWQIAVKNRQLRGDTDAAVSTKSSIRSNHPSVFDHVPYRILGKVVLDTFVLFTDHVRVALEDDRRYIFVSRSSLLHYKHVSGLICPAFKISGCCKFLKICNDLFLMT